jgi:RHS repeat-associated protein
MHFEDVIDVVSGAVVEDRQYKVFGGLKVDRLRVYYYRSRYYGAEEGRFLQEDKIRLEGGGMGICIGMFITHH